MGREGLKIVREGAGGRGGKRACEFPLKSLSTTSASATRTNNPTALLQLCSSHLWNIQRLDDVSIEVAPEVSQTGRKLRKARHGRCKERASEPRSGRRHSRGCCSRGSAISFCYRAPPQNQPAFAETLLRTGCGSCCLDPRARRHASERTHSVIPCARYIMIHPSEGSDPRPSFGEEHSSGEEKDGASLHDVERALRNNFAATGVIDDVTVRVVPVCH